MTDEELRAMIDEFDRDGDGESKCLVCAFASSMCVCVSLCVCVSVCLSVTTVIALTGIYP